MLWRKILDMLLPPRCISCGIQLSDKNALCPECFAKIKFIAKPYCKICGRPFEKLSENDGAICADCLKNKRRLFSLQRSAYIYDDDSKHMIINFKFHDKTSYAGVLAQFMYNAGKDIFAQNPDVIIPVPLHYKRLLTRKYNQSALLAHELTKLSKIKTDNLALKRCKNTIPQVQFSGKQRIKNVKGAFVVKDVTAIKGKKVVLIDDVMTTGSTLKECALALKKAGAKEIYALTVARTIKQ